MAAPTSNSTTAMMTANVTKVEDDSKAAPIYKDFCAGRTPEVGVPHWPLDGAALPKTEPQKIANCHGHSTKRCTREFSLIQANVKRAIRGNLAGKSGRSSTADGGAESSVSETQHGLFLGGRDGRAFRNRGILGTTAPRIGLIGRSPPQFGTERLLASLPRNMYFHRAISHGPPQDTWGKSAATDVR